MVLSISSHYDWLNLTVSVEYREIYYCLHCFVIPSNSKVIRKVATGDENRQLQQEHSQGFALASKSSH